MNLITKRIKGTQDLLPDKSDKFEYVESVLKNQAKLYGFRLVRTPVIEHTVLFERSVGENSDVVSKEMYTFLDKSGRSVTLRPEGTAGTLRAILENGLHNNLPVKVMYITSCYRYEKPQNSRYREFFQFGVETFGSKSCLADSEIIFLVYSIFKKLKVQNLKLEINSLGCSECKKKFNNDMKKYLEKNFDNFCGICKERMYRNPMRVFDCKNENCKKNLKNAPIVLDYLCLRCKNHFDDLKKILDLEKVNYIVNPRIVRGLDYYTKTVFEFIDNKSEITVCGGGRYDNLSEEIGGPDLPSVGFGLGIERLLSLVKDYDLEIYPKVYISIIGEKARFKAVELAENFRNNNISTEIDILNNSLKSQVKYADKAKAKYCLFLGDRELENNFVKFRNMVSGEEKEIDMNNILNYVK
ncbi:MAG: histidine--tRNA ligase [Candidatus Paraimprobicoccus trichonymphae]|uniref:Histidine--tRNA ligase n=1 Tax=Candidatus Paraimprobicoccus trichonymphae TaxID=3033793 RepID=A0AA48I5D9_9FIRM|nr:MAG: histidine--tRNA ligase [Candidatus Paraimprobicoccus trichonymphae]